MAAKDMEDYRGSHMDAKEMEDYRVSHMAAKDMEDYRVSHMDAKEMENYRVSHMDDGINETYTTDEESSKILSGDDVSEFKNEIPSDMKCPHIPLKKRGKLSCASCFLPRV